MSCILVWSCIASISHFSISFFLRTCGHKQWHAITLQQYSMMTAGMVIGKRKFFVGIGEDDDETTESEWWLGGDPRNAGGDGETVHEDGMRILPCHSRMYLSNNLYVCMCGYICMLILCLRLSWPIMSDVVQLIILMLFFPFVALTLLVGWQEGYPASKNLIHAIVKTDYLWDFLERGLIWSYLQKVSQLNTRTLATASRLPISIRDKKILRAGGIVSQTQSCKTFISSSLIM